jgi:hypothetical protein
MTVFRVFCMDINGKITSSETVEASTVEEAVERVRALNLGTGCEVWDGQRLVARISKELVASYG